MEKKLITSLILSFATAVSIACFSISCRTMKSAASNKVQYVPVFKQNQQSFRLALRDTTPKRTQAEMQSYLNSQYKLNYDSYFAPQLNKMNSTISRLANSNQKLTDILSAMRQRSIAHNDSMDSENKKYIEQALAATEQSMKYQKEVIIARKEYQDKIQEQIRSNDRQAIICMAGLITLGCIIISLFLYCRNKFRKIEKRLDYA